MDKEMDVLHEVTEKVREAKKLIAEAQDRLAEAADICAVVTMEDRLNSFWDDLENLRFDLEEELKSFRNRLEKEAEEKELV